MTHWAEGGNTSTCDSQNELVSMNGGVVTLQYDGDGNRVAKTASGSTTRYLVDDLNPTGYAQVVEEIVNGTPQREYTYGLQRIDEDQVIQGAWTPSFYGYDGFGTVRQLTNASGAVTDSYEYDAFGNEITSTGSTPNNYLYRGEQYDPDLGLYYLRARYYDPLTGRFMSRDPEDGDPEIPATLHKYLYAGGDPVIGYDATGRDDPEEYQFLSSSLIQGGSKLGTSDYVLSKGGLVVAGCFYGLARAIYALAHDQSFWPGADGAMALIGCATGWPLPPVT